MDKREFLKRLALIGASVTVAVGSVAWINNRRKNANHVSNNTTTPNKETENIEKPTASSQFSQLDASSSHSPSKQPNSKQNANSHASLQANSDVSSHNKTQKKSDSLEHSKQAQQEPQKSMVKKLELSDTEWKKRLTKEQYYILRKEGTERPFTSPLNNEKRDGVFHCVGCDLELFTSKMKYDSGTGWPSFFTHIEGHFETKDDYNLIAKRTEYHCARCGGHHGHVFDDGPQPTGQRWCNNGIALKFVPQKT
ncbi:peptide methionine sulfoxide reductase MsrB [Spirochaetota bacterium]|nr:peptide methionine sulfoxide reductase MsrB [Spirochaetota bacterium]